MFRDKQKHQGRLFAIGDIHGCPDELAAIVKAIAPGADDTVVFVGDYVDRGPSARDAVEVILELQKGPANIITLKGNHEDMMLSFLGYHGHHGDSFLFNGGAATMDSYGVGEEDLEHAAERLPEEHLKFYRNLSLSYLRPPYFFVHAGIAPARQLEEQDPEDMLWIRQEFIAREHSTGVIVVFGHTPMRGVMIDLPFKLGIDTGLVYGGKLTCLEFNEGVIYQCERGSRRVKARQTPLR